MSLRGQSAEKNSPTNPVAKFSLLDIGRRLKSQPAWHEKKRNSTVLFKEDGRHAHLTAMHAATLIPTHNTPCALNILVLEGRVRLVTDWETTVLTQGDLAALEGQTRFSVEADKESLFVLEFFPTGSELHATDGGDYFDNWV